MSSYTSSPPSREQNQKKLVDIIRIGHDSLDREHTKLQEAVLGIYAFQAIPSDPKTKKVYQYEIENQSQYDKNEVLITSALGTFEPVVNDSKEKLFRLEMQVPKTETFDMPRPQAPLPEKAKDQPDTRSLLEKIKGTPEKSRIITPDDPYQDGLKFLRETMHKMNRFERFQEYQSYGVDLAITASFPTMIQYLRFHRTRFKFEIAPTILRVHRQYIEIIKDREKQGAIQFAKKLDEEIFQTRNDFMMQPPK
jgi:hypothetical protein